MERELKEVANEVALLTGDVQHVNSRDLCDLIRRATDANSVQHTRAQARKAAAQRGFSIFDASLVLQRHPTSEEDFAKMVAEQQEERLKNSGVSTERVARFLDGVSEVVRAEIRADIDRLRRFAVIGVDIPVTAGFVPSGASGETHKPRALYREIQPAYDLLVELKVKAGLAMAFVADMVRKLPFVNLMPPHWVPKAVASHTVHAGETQLPKSALGRELVDAGAGEHPLNCPEIREFVSSEDGFGPLEHATLRDMAACFVDVRNRAMAVKGDDKIVASTVDVEAAFPRLRVNRNDVCKLGVEIAGGIVVFWLFAFFGWTGFPAAWGVVTRVLAHVTNSSIFGRSVWYVDDALLVTHESEHESDIGFLERKGKQLLGEDAFGEGKSVKKVEYVENYVGWSFHARYMWVGIGRRLLDRMVYTLVTTDFTKKLPVELLQKVAAWCSRLGVIFQAPRALTAVLHSEVGRAVLNQHSFCTLSDGARAVVAVWRAHVLLSGLEPDASLRYRRSLFSLVPNFDPPSFIISFDGSPLGCGAVLRRWTRDGPGQVIAVRGVRFPYELRHGNGPRVGELDSQYQNFAELAGVLLGLLAAATLGLGGSRFLLTGDSRVAIRWVETERFRGANCRKSALVFAHLLSQYGFSFADAVWRPKEENGVEDLLSREFTAGARAEALRALGGGEASALECPEGERLSRLWSLCDPTHPLPTSGPGLFGLLADIKTL